MRRFAALLAVSITLSVATAAQASLPTWGVSPGNYVEMSLSSQYYAENGETGGEFGMTVYQYPGQNPPRGTLYTFCRPHRGYEYRHTISSQRNK